jgi:hypothetical protein
MSTILRKQRPCDEEQHPENACAGDEGASHTEKLSDGHHPIVVRRDGATGAQPDAKANEPRRDPKDEQSQRGAEQLPRKAPFTFFRR